MTHVQTGTSDATQALPRAARFLVAAAAVCVAGWLAWESVCVGASRLLAEHALRARAAQEAEVAARLAPGDADAHFARAWLLSNEGELEGALRAYERALALRPRDHVLWLESGKVRDRAGEAERALADFREAARLAPFYAQPRWQLGNALLRAGLEAEALAELRRAAESDRALYPNLLQTIWHASGRDATSFVRAASPRTNEETLNVVRFLIREGAGAEGLRVLRGSGAVLTAEARGALVADLVAAEEFAGAYAVWSEGRGGVSGSLTDGGFEKDARTDEEGFGWRFAAGVRGVALSLDADGPRAGARSLKVEYAGNSEPSTPAVSQLVAVESGARYRLTFSAKTKELVTGGPPFVEVVSAAKSGETLADAPPLSNAQAGWQDFALEFKAPPSGAVRVALKRRPCASAPCPAFGSLWLDAFELRRL